MFTHSTHFIYGYMASDIWLRTILIVRKETRCCHIGYSYRLTARVLLYAPSHRQDNTYHSLCYTSRGALTKRTKPHTKNGFKDSYGELANEIQFVGDILQQFNLNLFSQLLKYKLKKTWLVLVHSL